MNDCDEENDESLGGVGKSRARKLPKETGTAIINRRGNEVEDAKLVKNKDCTRKPLNI